MIHYYDTFRVPSGNVLVRSIETVLPSRDPRYLDEWGNAIRVCLCYGPTAQETADQLAAVLNSQLPIGRN